MSAFFMRENKDDHDFLKFILIIIIMVNKSDLIHVLVHLVEVEIQQEHYEIVYELT